MGQTLKTISNGGGAEREAAIEEFRKTYQAEEGRPADEVNFHHAVYKALEKINESVGSTQLLIPDREKLDKIFKDRKMKDRKLEKDEFRQILQDVVMSSGVSGFGGFRDFLIFIFGVPAATLFIKQKVAPKSVPNDIFIPGVTSATFFLLAKLGKL